MNANNDEIIEQLKYLRQEELVQDVDKKDKGTLAAELWYRERHR